MPTPPVASAHAAHPATVAMHASPLQQAYQQASQQPGFVADTAQTQALTVLDDCFRALHAGRKRHTTGVYLWGPVGRGKTWLLDLFHRQLRLRSRRQHFHQFMQWVHRRLSALSGTADPLRQLAAELAADIRVLCFDELFVSDIGDAMLLGGLFQRMFDAGIVIVATSNQPPQQLYADGFNRERFLPAIAALQRHMQVVAVDGGCDHRLHPGERLQRYWVNEPAALAAAFAALSGGLPASDRPLSLHGRTVAVVRYSDAAIWLRFADLCAQPLAAMDYMALCARFPAILLGQVPDLNASPQAQKIARGTEDGVAQVAAGDRRLPDLSSTDNSVRRFIALVDECYDRRIPLYIDAAVPLHALYSRGHLLAPFQRTHSRLQAMQYRRF